MAASSVEALVQQLMTPDAIRQVAAQTGMDEVSAQRAVAAALPTLLAGLGINAADPERAQAILNALDKDHDGNILEDIPAYVAAGGDRSQGAKIVNHILGDREPAVADGLARKAGVSSNQMGGILAALAPLVMGALSRDTHQNNAGSNDLFGMLLGQNGLLSSLLGGGGSSQSAGGLGSVLGGMLGGGSSQGGFQDDFYQGGQTGSQGGNDLGSLLGGLLGGGSSQADSGIGDLLGGLLGGGSSSQSGNQPKNDLGSLLSGLLGG